MTRPCGAKAPFLTFARTKHRGYAKTERASARLLRKWAHRNQHQPGCLMNSNCSCCKRGSDQGPDIGNVPNKVVKTDNSEDRGEEINGRHFLHPWLLNTPYMA